MSERRPPPFPRPLPVDVEAVTWALSAGDALARAGDFEPALGFLDRAIAAAADARKSELVEARTALARWVAETPASLPPPSIDWQDPTSSGSLEIAIDPTSAGMVSAAVVSVEAPLTLDSGELEEVPATTIQSRVPATRASAPAPKRVVSEPRIPATRANPEPPRAAAPPPPPAQQTSTGTLVSVPSSPRAPSLAIPRPGEVRTSGRPEAPAPLRNPFGAPETARAGAEGGQATSLVTPKPTLSPLAARPPAPPGKTSVEAKSPNAAPSTASPPTLASPAKAQPPASTAKPNESASTAKPNESASTAKPSSVASVAVDTPKPRSPQVEHKVDAPSTARVDVPPVPARAASEAPGSASDTDDGWSLPPPAPSPLDPPTTVRARSEYPTAAMREAMRIVDRPEDEPMSEPPSTLQVEVDPALLQRPTVRPPGGDE